jgi:hypothetical protein
MRCEIEVHCINENCKSKIVCDLNHALFYLCYYKWRSYKDEGHICPECFEFMNQCIELNQWKEL